MKIMKKDIWKVRKMLLYFLLFIIILILIIEIITVLFSLTGLPTDKARFQVISLLTGSGFTTKESELIMQHSSTRKLAQVIMIIGYVGFVTGISFLINIMRTSLSVPGIIGIIIFFVCAVFILKNRYVVENFDSLIKRIILGGTKKVPKSDIYELINNKGYGLYKIFVNKDSAIVGKPLKENNLKENGIQVLNIDRGSELINSPDGNEIIQNGDTLLVYGKTESIMAFL